MTYINVKRNPALVRDKNSGAIINNNTEVISSARTRKYLQKLEKEKIQRLEEDVDIIKQDMGEIKNLLLRMLEEKNGSN